MNSKENKKERRTMALKICAVVLALIFIVSAFLLVVELIDNNQGYSGDMPSLDKNLSYNGICRN